MLHLLAAISSALAPQGAECREIAMPQSDGSTKPTLMCRNGDGAWREAGAAPAQRGALPLAQPVAAASAPGLPPRARVTYQGSYEAKVADAFRIPNRLSLGTLLDAASRSGGTELVGTITFKAAFEGPIVTMETETSGGDTGRFTLSGPVTRGQCRLQAPGGKITYQGRCDATGFSGTISGSTNRGKSVKGRFEASPISEIVDAVVLEQRAAEAKRLALLEQQRKAAAAQAAIDAMPKAGPAAAAQLDGFVRKDSAGWAFNRYDAGSMRNVRIASGSAKTGTMILRGEYTYNGGQSGWVMANMVRGKLNCIQFWDAMIGCRALRTAAQGQAMRSAAFDMMFGGSGGGSGGAAAYDGDDQDRNMRRQMASMQAPPPPPPPPLPSPLGW